MRLLIRSLLLVSVIAVLALPLWAQGDQSAPAAGGMDKMMMGKKTVKGSEWVKKVQEALAAKGNDPGPADGMMGKKTVEAIKAFQTANGLKATGKVDKETAEKLGVEMPMHHGQHMKKEPATQTQQ